MKTYAQVQDFLHTNQTSIAHLPSLNIAILRNITVEALEPYIRYFAYQIGFNAKVHFGEYDNVFQESVGGSTCLKDANLDVILIFTKLETLSPALIKGFSGLTPTDVAKEKERLGDFFQNILDGIRKQSDAMILWHGFEIPSYPALGIWDSQTNAGQSETISELNRILKSNLLQHSNTYFIDTNLCLGRLGLSRYYDSRYWHLAKAPYSRDALAEISREDFKFIRALKGKNKKCLVLDCDNVLWGGVIGEDGMEGIKLGTTYPGSIYYELQQCVVNLYHRGVILALCSKNNPADVWNVFQNHPDMILKEEHIATAQINWQDKATNLRQIALDLNIGLDSLVFVDDSEFEIALIQQELPEVATLHLDSSKAVFFVDKLMSYGWFDTLTITDEDKVRGQMYRAEASRNKMRAAVTNLNEYYRSLELVAEIQFASKFTIPRIAQLTQKTNQFNLTTKRYSEADIENFANAPDSDVLCLRLRDKFGDLGIVGVCILEHQSDHVSCIDTFLFSCRALGRKAEDVLLQQALLLAKYRGSKIVRGIYIPTKKNEQTRTFYETRGFERYEMLDNGTCSFVLDLGRYEIKPVTIYKNILSEIIEG